MFKVFLGETVVGYRIRNLVLKLVLSERSIVIDLVEVTILVYWLISKDFSENL